MQGTVITQGTKEGLLSLLKGGAMKHDSLLCTSVIILGWKPPSMITTR